MPTGPVTIDSPAPLDADTLFLRSMKATEGLSESFEYTVMVQSSADLQPNDLLGATTTVHLQTLDGGARHYNGIITDLDYLGSEQVVNYRLVLRPWLWLLTRSSGCRIFQNESIVDIVTGLFQELGFSAYDASGLTETYAPREYVVQYRETDFDFVSRLLELEGIYYYFRHDATTHTLVLVDASSSHVAPPTTDGSDSLSIALRLPDQNRAALTEYVDHWRMLSSIQTGAYSHADFDFTKSRATLFARRAHQPGNNYDGLEVYEYPGGFDTTEVGESVALVRLQERQAALQASSGWTNCRTLSVGFLFTLTDHPRDDQNQDYLVTSATFRLKGHAPESGGGGGGGGGDAGGGGGELFDCVFAAIASTIQFRPPSRTRRALVRGPQTATVVGPDGEEIWTDQYGRVKVQFHWDRDGQGDENSSCFVRVSQAWAGPQFGAMHLPRIGQEVIVDFLEGDPDRPIITGRVYNDANMPPYDLPDKKTQSGIKGRSTPGGNASGGNEIRFEDAVGQEDLYVHAENTHTTLVEGDQTTTVLADRTLTVTGSETTTISGGRTTTVTLADALSVVGASMTTVGGDRSVAVTGSDETSVTGTYALGVQGSASEQIDGDFTRTVSGTVDLSADGVQTELFGDDFTERHAGHRVIIVGGPTAKRSSMLHVEGAVTTYAATTIEATAVKSFTINCGNSQIVVKPDAVTISSPSILLTSPDIELSGKAFALTTTDSLALATKAFTVNATDSIDLESKKVTAASSGASVALDSNATIQGGKVQLQGGSGGSVQSATKDVTPPKVTTLQLVDDSGNPLANQRVVLRTGGESGEERTIVLDATGTFQITGDDPFEVLFPDFPDAKKG